jgi:hypothetical protein
MGFCLSIMSWRFISRRGLDRFGDACPGQLSALGKTSRRGVGAVF